MARALMLAITLFLSCAPACAAPWTDRGSLTWGPFGDGATTVAWQSDDGAVHVLDGAGDQRDLAAPDGCADWTLEGAGAGAVVAACPHVPVAHGAVRHVTVVAASGLAAGWDGPDPGPGGAMLTVTAVGAAWISGLWVGYHEGGTLFFSRGDPSLLRADDGGSEHDAPDVDRPGLYRRMCDGVTRVPEVSDDPYGATSDRWWPGLAGPGFAAVTGLRRAGWRVHRCGSRESWWTPADTSPVLGGGLASWPVRPGTLRVVTAGGRSASVRLPAATSTYARVGRLLAVRHDVRGAPTHLWTTRLRLASKPRPSGH